MLRLLRRGAFAGILVLGYGAYRYHFVLPRGEDGKPIVPEVRSAPARPGPAYDAAAAERRLDEMAAVRRHFWEAHLEKMAADGASDEALAIERAEAERSMAENDAAWRHLRAREARRISGESAPKPGPVERKRAEIERVRQKRKAGWDRWLARFEERGDLGRLAQEQAWIERREAEDRASEDRELAELEATMRRRSAAAGLQGGGARD